MLEPKTIQKMNELIRGMAQFCIKSYQSDQPVDSGDLRALAELTSALNVPPDPPGDPAPVVGFVVSDQAADSDGDEE